MKVYVSLTGNDRNSGDKASPLCSLKAALEKAKGGIIYFEEGRYFFDDTVVMNEENSGTVIKALGNVIFDGGILIGRNSVKDYDGKIKYIDLKPYNLNLGEYRNRGFRRSYVNAPNELFINGKPYTVARYPKTETIKYTSEDIIECGSKPISKEYDMRCPVIRLNTGRMQRMHILEASRIIRGLMTALK